MTATWTPTVELLPTATPTPLAVAAADDAGSDNDFDVPPDDPGAGDTTAETIDASGDDDDDMPVSALVLGGILALSVLGYLGVYVIQAANIARYREGFILSVCPVCETGDLYVEDRRYRMLGIPRVRRTVRCDTCRSVLRQVGSDEWRYAVDGVVNADLYAAYNGCVLTEDELLDISPEFRDAPLEFIDEDDGTYRET